jgi:hypothetical protein
MDSKAMKKDQFSRILATKPKRVIRWARRDVIGFWLGRTVSAKVGYKNLQSPWLLGTIVEVGPAGWVAVLWENGSINSNWNRSELDDYQGPSNSNHQDVLLKTPTAYDEIVKNLQKVDRSQLRRNGFPIDFKLPSAERGLPYS